MNNRSYYRISELRNDVNKWLDAYSQNEHLVSQEMYYEREYIVVAVLDRIGKSSCAHAPTWAKEVLRLYK
jgi:hypothetical protein